MINKLLLSSPDVTISHSDFELAQKINEIIDYLEQSSGECICTNYYSCHRHEGKPQDKEGWDTM